MKEIVLHEDEDILSIAKIGKDAVTVHLYDKGVSPWHKANTISISIDHILLLAKTIDENVKGE